MFGFARLLQVYVVDMWDFSVDKVTLFYSFISLVAAFSSLVLFARVTKFLSLKAITIWASIIGGILTIIIVIPQAEIWIWFITLPAVLIIVLSLSSGGSYLSTLVSGDRQGRVLGNNLALQVGAEAISRLCRWVYGGAPRTAPADRIRSYSRPWGAAPYNI